jgi:SAM-dependent methyltransferase
MRERPQMERGAFEREWRRRFERFAQDADSPHQISGWSEPGLRRRIAAFRQLLATLALTRGRQALDLGSGAGTYVRLLAAEGHRVIGVDYSIASLRKSVLTDSIGPAHYVGAEAYALPFPDGAFDLVVVIGVFQALSEPERAIREVHRVLRPGGHLILEILNADAAFLWPRRILERIRRRAPGVRPYRRTRMRHWLQACGFHPERSAPIYLPPRSLPNLESALEHPISRAAFRVIPGLSALTAAAFLIASRKKNADPIEAPGS